jgi:hypothetical protein
MDKSDKLFRTYARNFSLVLSKGRPDITIEEEIYACPLCSKLFGRSNLTDLTLEHVPPKALGGRISLLTCKNCNSSHGHSLDSHLVKRVLANRLLKLNPGASSNVRYRINESIATDGNLIILDKKALEFRFDKNRTNPRSIKALGDFFDNNPDKIQIAFSLNNGAERKITLVVKNISIP